MRIFSSARIAVIDADPRHRAMLCTAMIDFGMSQIVPAASVEEAHERAREAPVDLCIVNLTSFAQGLAPDAKIAIPNPFDPVRTPGILLAADTSRAAARIAAAQGYRVVLPSPASPRIVYRRVGSILQRVRRANRVRPPGLGPVGSAQPAEAAS